jgi:hypothetical protein
MAQEKYIHEPQLLKPVGRITKEELEDSFKRMMQEHHHMMEKLS